ncbi:CerR family C-terminal domain-containing protein [Desulfofustis glycolicus]|uniref:Transcriptional regulator, TetR family n=1 Tax=Desulfofustis glycolicus DSM 9705 TaxID=1121409 RepID=A0A1M5X073_9BACT|nr:CerR family C-terminal domain-containing protein [Desulfofustis glycolicus]MCB2218646.1 CerR family C-terminal domain-containing protein [Desulfobulbaceae bacterium]SHH93130.1 transcriptional regulator, TetR family [Desulfofustis glycolicus DSM 9705]
MPKPTIQDEPLPGAKERLLEAATDIFGRYGYDTATTRMIAREAHVNIAAIPYYFNGKEGLYFAVIDHIVGLVLRQVQPIIAIVSASSFSGPDAKEKATSLLEQFLAGIVGFMIGSPEAHRVARIVLREQLDPSAAFDRIFAGFMEAALDTLTTLIQVISENDSERTAKIRAMTLIGQVLIFRVARETVVRGLAMKGYTRIETAEIQNIIIEQTRSLMAALQSH